MKRLILATMLLCTPAYAAEISGPATVHDGDTIKIDGQSVRLFGIDAPELRQTCRYMDGEIPCGQMARDALSRIIENRPVTCTYNERDRYGRIVGKCYAEDENLSLLMVMQGWALSYYAKDYKGVEEWAVKNREGMHEYEYLAPCRYRGTCK